MKPSELGTTALGIVDTVDARLDGIDEERLSAWLEEIGGEQGVLDLAGGDADDLDAYFEALAEGGSDEALTAIGGDFAYARAVGRPIDRVEDALVAWLEERQLDAPVSRDPRRRPSGLAERALVAA